MDRRTMLAALVAGSGAIAGCGYRPGPGDRRWTADMLGEIVGSTDRHLVVRVPPIVDWGTGALHFLDSRTGERTGSVGTGRFEETPMRLERDPEPVPFRSSIGVGSDLAIGATASGTHAIRPDGTVAWSIDRPLQTPAVAGDVVLGHEPHSPRIWAVARTDGSTVWSADLPALDVPEDAHPASRPEITAAHATGDGTVALFSIGGVDLVVVRGEGTIGWRQSFERRVHGIRPIGPEVVVVFEPPGLGGPAQICRRFDRETGERIDEWSIDAGDTAIAADRLYVATDGRLEARALRTGEVLWTLTPDGPPIDDVVIADDRGVVVSIGEDGIDAEYHLGEVSIADRELVWQGIQGSVIGLFDATIVLDTAEGLMGRYRRPPA